MASRCARLYSLGDTLINPVYDELSTLEVGAVRLTEAEIDVSLDQDTYEAFYDSALDPYIFFRSAYVQNRAGKVEE
jgi:ABC-type transporter lipoprotein component MlaA